MKKINKIIFVVCLLTIFLICNHLVDITNNAYWLGFGVSNGVFSSNPLILYHVAWYTSYLCMFVLSIFSIKEISKNGDKND